MMLPEFPYRGLSSFRFQDHNIFGGRAAEIDRLGIMLLEYRGMLIYGPSGIGKSSLVEAGFIPHLLDENKFIPTLIRINPNEKSTFVITRISTNKEKTLFLPGLFDQFIPEGDQTVRKINVSLSDFSNLIFKLEADYLKVLENDQYEPPEHIQVLIFDQFEEFVTLFEEQTIVKKPKESETQVNTDDLEDQIVEFLRKCYFTKYLPVKLVFIFREDYFTRLGKLFKAFPDIKDNYFHLDPLKTDLLKEVIRRPFDTNEKKTHFNHAFPPEVISLLHVKLEEYYLNRKIDLTEVQIVCFHIYEIKDDIKRLNALEKTGIALILQDFYKNLLENLLHEEKPLAIDVLSLLVLNEKTRNIIHREDMVSQLSRINSEDAILMVLEKLEKGIKLIRQENRQDGAYYEIISEAIIPYINTKKLEKEKFALERKYSRSKQKIWLAVFIMLIAVSVAIYLATNNYRAGIRLDTIKKIKANELWYENIPTDSMRQLIVENLYDLKKSQNSERYIRFRNSLEMASKAYTYRNNFDNNAALAITYKAYKNDSNPLTEGIFSDFARRTIMPDTLSLGNGIIKGVEQGFGGKYFLITNIENLRYNILQLDKNNATSKNITPDNLKERPRLVLIKGIKKPYYLFYDSQNCYLFSDLTDKIEARKTENQIAHIWSLKKNTFTILFTNGKYEDCDVNQNGIQFKAISKHSLIGKTEWLKLDVIFTNKYYARFNLNSKRSGHIREVILKATSQGDISKISEDFYKLPLHQDLLDINTQEYRLILNNFTRTFMLYGKKGLIKGLKGRKYASMSCYGNLILANYYSKAYITTFKGQSKKDVKTDSLTTDLPLLFTPYISPANSNYIFFIKNQSIETYSRKLNKSMYLFIPANGDSQFLDDSTYVVYAKNVLYTYHLNNRPHPGVSEFASKYARLFEQYIESDNDLSDAISKENGSPE